MIDCSGLYQEASEKHYTEQYEPFLTKELGYRCLKDCFLVPPGKNIWTGGIYDSIGEPAPDTSLHSLLEQKQEFSEEDAPYRDETVVYFGLMYPLWGHCITDELSRAWFIKYSEDYIKKYKDCTIVCLAKGKAFGQSFKTLLSILGIDSDKIEVIDKTCRFKEVIVPDRCFTCESGYYQFTKEYRMMIEEIREYGRKLRESCDLYTPEKLYISYSHYAGKGIFGEDKLEKYFASKGYEILYPEDHSFEEQLMYMLGAKEIASTVGSCSHNTIFAEGSARLTLIPRADYLGGYQPTLCALWNQETRFIDAHLSVLAPKKSPWEGPFCFTVSEKLAEAFGDSPSPTYNNIEDFENYLKEGFKIRDPRDTCCPDECYKFISRADVLSMYNKSPAGLSCKAKNALKNIYHKIKK